MDYISKMAEEVAEFNLGGDFTYTLAEEQKEDEPDDQLLQPEEERAHSPGIWHGTSGSSDKQDCLVWSASRATSSPALSGISRSLGS